MIANGTGIGPFLGMIRENKKKIPTHLYCGFRFYNETSKAYEAFANEQLAQNHLANFKIAYSKEQNPSYVIDLITKDADFFVEVLKRNGVIMICGSLLMQKDVESILNQILIKKSEQPLEYYQSKGQLLSDCY